MFLIIYILPRQRKRISTFIAALPYCFRLFLIPSTFRTYFLFYFSSVLFYLLCFEFHFIWKCGAATGCQDIAGMVIKMCGWKNEKQKIKKKWKKCPLLNARKLHADKWNALSHFQVDWSHNRELKCRRSLHLSTGFYGMAFTWIYCRAAQGKAGILLNSRFIARY